MSLPSDCSTITDDVFSLLLLGELTSLSLRGERGERESERAEGREEGGERREERGGRRGERGGEGVYKHASLLTLSLTNLLSSLSRDLSFLTPF